MKIKNSEETWKSTIFIDLSVIAFIFLKLCGIIDWPWIWVLAPLWIWLILIIVVIIVAVIVSFIEDRRWFG